MTWFMDMTDEERDSLVTAIQIAVGLSWCEETASPGDAPEWSEDNPAKGQCAVTALLIQEILGGDLMRCVVDGFGSHYFNRLPDGTIVDLTRRQFPEGTVVPDGEPRDREYVLDSEPARNAQTPERYDLLRTLCMRSLLNIVQVAVQTGLSEEDKI
jgi:hypothetical protein